MSVTGEHRVLELYSGLGAFHYAFQQCNAKGTVIAAADINNACNTVYQHNFKGTKLYQRNIEAININEYERLAVDTFFLSPPCQPYTRQGKQRGMDDPRAKSFKYVIELLPRMTNPPLYILLENVKGFELSDSQATLVETLKCCGYSWQEFLLTPSQFGVPNSRLRYFLLAKKQPLSFPCPPTGTILHSIPNNMPCDCHSDKQTSQPGSHGQSSDDDCAAMPRALQAYLDPPDQGLDQYLVPRDVMLKKGMLMDIVQPSSRRSCCFTKAYGHYVEGTGSVLQMNTSTMYTEVFDKWQALLDQRKALGQSCVVDSDPQLVKAGDEIMDLKIRYFTEREIARLHSFPDSFSFPTSITAKAARRLLGNSLNVTVAAQLMNYLFAEPAGQ